MIQESIFEEIKKQVKEIIGEKGSHDFSHTERVYKLSIEISKNLEVDLDVVKAAALLHDVARPKEDKGKIKDHAAQGAIDARKILKKVGFPKEKIEAVCNCILLHNKKEDLPNMIEVRILKEADGLETIGAMGIARCFSFSGEKYIWSSPEYLNPITELNKHLNLDYFKLAIAKDLAKKRISLTQDFCIKFAKEYNMEI